MRSSAVFALFTLALAGCGYVGDPLPPALDIPLAIQDLRGVQRGDKIILAFTPNPKTTEAIVLKSINAIDLRAGENIQGGFDIGRWADGARKIPVPDTSFSPHELSISTEGFVGKEIIFGVRTTGPKGRSSLWSNLVTLHVVPTLAVPTGLNLVPTVKGIQLQWTRQQSAPGTEWRVWRLVEGEKDPTILGNAGDANWLDSNTEYGKTYSYTLQRILKTGEHQEAESELSATVSLKFEDKFPPAVPSGLTAIAGIKSVELNWNRNQESDLKSYVLFRAEGSATLVRVADLGIAPNYSDTKVESGKTYRYAIAAVDELGNISEPCAAIEIAVH